MIISIASGKGGTGKTTIAVNLALTLSRDFAKPPQGGVAKSTATFNNFEQKNGGSSRITSSREKSGLNNVQLIDCDVEEPNAALFLNPVITDKKSSYIPVPVIDRDKCTYCGKCGEVCEYNAIAVIPQKEDSNGNVLVFPNLCHGCGACQYLCPENAITEINREIGVIEIGSADNVQFVHGKLNVGEAMAPPVIRQVKRYINPTHTVIIDAPPGTSCPVITAVSGTDFCVLVTEPTPFGLNDLQLAVEAMRKLNIPFGVVINRCDLGDYKTEK